MINKSNENFTAWYALCVLTLANLFSITDRQILALLIEPIRNELNISDTQISLLGGFAFAIFYTFFALPISYLADRKSRRVIITIGIATWSIMTSVSGLARNFMYLLLARVGVGVGEASLGPAAYSIISDYFPPDRLGRAMGVFAIGSSMGTGLALIFGAVILTFVTELPTITLPVLGVLSPWRLAFIFVGLPGLLVAGLLMTMTEPKRKNNVAIQTDELILSNTQNTGNNIFIFLIQNWKIYVPLLLGFSLLVLVLQANLLWLPTFHIRTYGLEVIQSGMILGSVLLIFGILGSITGGLLVDLLRTKGHADAAYKVLLIATAIAIPLGVSMPLMTNLYASIALLSGFVFVLWVIGAVYPTALVLITPNHFRAQISALSFFVGNIIGMGIGPTAVALITDYIFADELLLKYSLAIVTILALPIAVIILLTGAKHYSLRAMAYSSH